MTIDEILTPAMQSTIKKFIIQGGILTSEDENFLDEVIDILEEMKDVSDNMKIYDGWRRMYND